MPLRDLAEYLGESEVVIAISEPWQLWIGIPEPKNGILVASGKKFNIEMEIEIS